MWNELILIPGPLILPLSCNSYRNEKFKFSLSLSVCVKGKDVISVLNILPRVGTDNSSHLVSLRPCNTACFSSEESTRFGFYCFLSSKHARQQRLMKRLSTPDNLVGLSIKNSMQCSLSLSLPLLLSSSAQLLSWAKQVLCITGGPTCSLCLLAIPALTPSAPP